jgi:hypothetical protein
MRVPVASRAGFCGTEAQVQTRASFGTLEPETYRDLALPLRHGSDPGSLWG